MGLKVPRPFAAVCRVSQVVARARKAAEAADTEAALLAAMAAVLALAIYYR